MNKTALLIIDAQIGLFSPENQKPHNSHAVLKNIKAMQDRARAKKVPVVFVQHTRAGVFDKGSRAWEICPEVAPVSGEPVVKKSEWDSFYGTNLQEVLSGLGTEKLIITGMKTEFCVDTTCRAAYSNGYGLTLVTDAHTTFDSYILSADQIINHHNGILRGIAALKTTGQVLDGL
ncbi:streptothricin hydrolase [Ruminiclostridium hungatei]|uniref:Streptothricin hydrolase n=1 Tax=Ruminiclostridium hungatei TaxID=48256 RepID=A0A1V4SNR8_RUMHU|nr:cysteine hydrolase family protein [Ruminiclostridium hungatei]OPX45443.1 streptothricin hydrolase [Ruminiclostridium hungatei]